MNDHLFAYAIERDLRAVIAWIGIGAIVLVAVFVAIVVSVARGSEIKGRIDIASGRVKATQIVNADGLSEWKFEEASK